MGKEEEEELSTSLRTRPSLVFVKGGRKEGQKSRVFFTGHQMQRTPISFQLCTKAKLGSLRSTFTAHGRNERSGIC